ncbi:hypothetical protein Hanom_Chr07g00628791 [Helianthus anomalus]
MVRVNSGIVGLFFIHKKAQPKLLFSWPALGVGGEDYWPGPGISRDTLFSKKTLYVYVKYFFNRIHQYKQQHRPSYKTIFMVYIIY